jgi:hypothetical protein
LRFADPRIHPLWHALILFRLLPNGFRRANLRPVLADLCGRDPQTPGPGAMTYQLRRLRLHGMIPNVCQIPTRTASPKPGFAPRCSSPAPPTACSARVSPPFCLTTPPSQPPSPDPSIPSKTASPPASTSSPSPRKT